MPASRSSAARSRTSSRPSSASSTAGAASISDLEIASMWSRARGTYDYGAAPGNGREPLRERDLTKVNVALAGACKDPQAVARKARMRKLAGKDEEERRAREEPEEKKVEPGKRFIKRAPWEYDEDDQERDRIETEAEAVRRVREEREVAREKEAGEAALEKSKMVRNTKLYAADNRSREGDSADGFRDHLRGGTPSDVGAMKF
ncbi:hypothetical protein TeGR_g11253 [Tetraparma gracilis]|uniref:Uncharacterized protein n=1 Tax=Tetraparma gracilis TaxID=2962635 RepID=A0ABQ6MKR7_9STRA|nr:hypothetical protein TeGR_g11253 [Tetraparma gracilis]